MGGMILTRAFWISATPNFPPSTKCFNFTKMFNKVRIVDHSSIVNVDDNSQKQCSISPKSKLISHILNDQQRLIDAMAPTERFLSTSIDFGGEKTDI